MQREEVEEVVLAVQELFVANCVVELTVCLGVDNVSRMGQKIILM
jgi:hypothetical protein